MKIYLVHPPSNFIRQAYGVKQKINFGHTPPLGIGYIAAYLEKDGHEVKILDASALELDVAETVRMIAEFKPDVVGISTLTNYAKFAKELAFAIKRDMPDVTTLLGGPHATYFYDSILDEMPGVDHVLYGEVDTVVNEYFRNLENHGDLHALKGLCFRDQNGRTVVNPPPEPLDNLDMLPMPAWHLYDFSLYRPLPLQYKNTPYFTLITSRGCSWRKCKFCFQAGYCAPKFRRHSPERVVEELEILTTRFGVKEVNFWDDTFIIDPKWIKKFTDLIMAKDIKLTWTASGRANHISLEMLEMLRDAGCWSIFIGIESGNQYLLDAIDKGITLEQAEKAVAAANDVGIETRAAFMLGLPTETPDAGLKTIQFAKKINPTYAIFYATHPRFGTQLYDIATKSGKFLSKEFKGMSNITYVPDGYKDAGELDKMLRKAYRMFYLTPRFAFKMLRKIRSFRDLSELIKGGVLFLGLSRLGQRTETRTDNFDGC